MSRTYRSTFRDICVILGILTYITSNILKFTNKAIREGRTLELLLSTVGLIASYYVLIGTRIYTYEYYFIPIITYIIFWLALFNFPKTARYLSSSHWADENWWWSLDGWEFEEEVAKVFRKQGYKAHVTKKTGDNGVDIIMYKDRKKIIVQCKHYKNNASPESVRALWGVRDTFNADEVIMVASSGVSEGSMNFISNHYPYYTLYTLNDIIDFATP